jgi:hypothetical protein
MRFNCCPSQPALPLALNAQIRPDSNARMIYLKTEFYIPSSNGSLRIAESRGEVNNYNLNRSYTFSNIYYPTEFQDRSLSNAIIAPISEVQEVPFKTQPNNNHIPRYNNEIRSRTIPVPVPNSSVTLESRSPWLLGR